MKILRALFYFACAGLLLFALMAAMCWETLTAWENEWKPA